MLPKVNAGHLLRKLKYSAPSLTAIDLYIGKEYDEAVHVKTMGEELNLSHLSISHKKAVSDIINKSWCFLRKKGVTVPVKDY